MSQDANTAITEVVLVFGTQNSVSFSNESQCHAISIVLPDIEDDEAFVDVEQGELGRSFIIELHVILQAEEFHFYGQVVRLDYVNFQPEFYFAINRIFSSMCIY